MKLIRLRITLVWLGLMLATALAWAIGHNLLAVGRLLGPLVLLVSYVKVRFVMQDFMELRHAPRFMTVVADIWIAFSLILLIGLYWVRVPI